MTGFRVLPQIFNPEPYRDVIMLALTEIGKRSSVDYSADDEYRYMVTDLFPYVQGFGCWLCCDTVLLGSGVEPGEAICGMSTMIVDRDGIGRAVGKIAHGWIRRGYHGEAFDLFLPVAKAWAKERECVALRTQCARSVEGYGRWIGQRGFTQVETSFELKLAA